MTLKHVGLEGYRTRLARTIACAEHLDELVRASSDFEAVHEPRLYIYSFHYVPSDLRTAVDENPDLLEPVEVYLADVHEAVVQRLQDEGLAYLTTTDIRGRTAYRLSICNHRTTPAVIDIVFEALAARGAELDRERRAELDVDDPDLRGREA
jgi:glutamate/tyrosine decarboxylase-like PLP-dependent enzyme